MDKATWALVLSGFAIVVSAAIGIAGYRLQRQVASIAKEKRLEEVEARLRADIGARLDPPGRPDYLVLSVTGATRARDVVVEVEPASILFESEPTAFPSLGPNQDVRLHVAITSDDFPVGAPAIVRVNLRWRDGLGLQAKEFILPL